MTISIHCWQLVLPYGPIIHSEINTSDCIKWTYIKTKPVNTLSKRDSGIHTLKLESGRSLTYQLWHLGTSQIIPEPRKRRAKDKSYGAEKPPFFQQDTRAHLRGAPWGDRYPSHTVTIQPRACPFPQGAVLPAFALTVPVWELSCSSSAAHSTAQPADLPRLPPPLFSLCDYSMQ